MLTPNWNPDRRMLRQFAGLWLLFLLGVGLYRAWRGGAFEASFGFAGPWIVPVVLWALAILAGVPGLIVPGTIRPLYVALTAVTFPIGWVVSHVLLALVYFLLFAGMGLIFTLIGRDRLRRRFDRSAATYWIDHEQRPGASPYFKLS